MSPPCTPSPAKIVLPFNFALTPFPQTPVGNPVDVYQVSEYIS